MTNDATGNEVSTVKYFPFGEVRAQTGEPGTDKLFTGQRLDQTGLYFYNARYYEAEIGRFISADTIVPNWTDPQSLNRYSYCLNNPLKYVDPSGHKIKVTDDYLGFAILKIMSLNIGASEILRNMIRADETYTFTWHFLSGSSLGLTAHIGGWGTSTAYINKSLKDEGDYRRVITNVAHEAYHLWEGKLLDSIQEELRAYKMEYEVGVALSGQDYYYAEGLLAQLSRLDPHSSYELKTARALLTDQQYISDPIARGLYRNIPLKPGKGIARWLQIIRMGAGVGNALGKEHSPIWVEPPHPEGRWYVPWEWDNTWDVKLGPVEVEVYMFGPVPVPKIF